MTHDPERNHRHTIRLPNYDYRQAGAYFVTLCTYQCAELFGEIVEGEMVLNDYGHIALDEWIETAIVRPGVILDEFIVMPNHFHAIVFLPNIAESDAVGAHSRAPSPTESTLK